MSAANPIQAAADALVASGYTREMADNVVARIATPLSERAYGQMCRNPSACKGKGYCPLDPTCAD